MDERSLHSAGLARDQQINGESRARVCVCVSACVRVWHRSSQTSCTARSEMRAVAFVQELIEQGALTGEFGDRLKKLLIHWIGDPATLAPLGAVSKFNIEPEFLDFLFMSGRASATGWLASTFDKIGVENSIDIRARFM